jgi:hypothetical protein
VVKIVFSQPLGECVLPAGIVDGTWVNGV